MNLRDLLPKSFSIRLNFRETGYTNPKYPEETIKARAFRWFLKRVVWPKEYDQMIEKINLIRDALAGKKTYLTALATIVGGTIAWSQGAVSTADYVKLVLDAVFAMTIRAGVSKV